MAKSKPVLRNVTAKFATLPLIFTAVVVFIGGPLWTGFYSFTNAKTFPQGDFVGWAQYARLFKTSRWLVSVNNIILYGSLSLVFTFVIGFLLAVLMDQKIRLEGAFRTIFLYPFALSFIVTGHVWAWIMNPILGLQHAVRQLGFTDFTFDWLADRHMVMYGILIAGLWQGTGLVMALLLAGLRGIDEEIWKAARVDGIPAWRTYISIVIPMMRPMLITTLVLVASGIVRLYDLVVATTAGGPGIASEVPAKYVYDYLFGAANIGQGTAASTVMLVTVGIVLIPWAFLEFGQRRGTR
ncbi:MAG: sugar ABC transporter permease [Devosia sp.]